ncbi:MAG: DUF294 nucleotidyltransferase-like domain-containing protein [Enhygromyxa sp.]
MTDDVFVQRAAHTKRVVHDLKQSLREQLGEHEEVLIGDHTCVYATGSVGRDEMGPSSDLDAYLVRVREAGSSGDAQALETAVACACASPLSEDGERQ